MTTAIQDTPTESLTGILTNVASHPNQITELFAQGLEGPHGDVIIPPNSNGLPNPHHDGLHHLTIPQTQCAEALCHKCAPTICAACNDTVTVRLDLTSHNPNQTICGPCQGLPH